INPRGPSYPSTTPTFGITDWLDTPGQSHYPLKPYELHLMAQSCPIPHHQSPFVRALCLLLS
ncbi:hypothetical protein JOQ06_025709, partial [Pogonophryne albipinna]